MREIQLNKGMVAIIDDCDFDMVSKYKWYRMVNGNGTYARGTINYKEIFMHRLILGLTGSEIVDHINGNGLDNRRENLRICTRSQNGMNRGAPKNSIYGIKGVSKVGNRWSARITVNNKPKYIGLFETKELAHAAYCKVGMELHGDFFNPGNNQFEITKEKQE